MGAACTIKPVLAIANRVPDVLRVDVVVDFFSFPEVWLMPLCVCRSEQKYGSGLSACCLGAKTSCY